MKTFKDILKILRREKEITQEELAKIVGVERSTVGKWESKNIIPTADMLLILSKYFGVSIDYLLGKTAFRNPMDLFEHWGLSQDGYFESAFDFGALLKQVRKEKNISIADVGKALCITETDVEDIEEGILPLNYDTAEKYANFLGTTVIEIFSDNNMNDMIDEASHISNDNYIRSYYINEETRRIAQQIYENPGMRTLFDASRDASPEDLQAVADMIKQLKKKENYED